MDWDHYSTEIVFATVCEGSLHGRESCQFFACSIRFDVQRWLHPNIADGRTRLVLTHEKASGYTPRSMSYELLIDFWAPLDVDRILETDWTTETRLGFFYLCNRYEIIAVLADQIMSNTWYYLKFLKRKVTSKLQSHPLILLDVSKYEQMSDIY